MLVVDFLGRLLNEATLAKIFVGLDILLEHSRTKILQYTDGMLVFAKASKNDICVSLSIIRRGPCSDWENSRTEDFGTWLYCKATSLPLNYLRLSLKSWIAL